MTHKRPAHGTTAPVYAKEFGSELSFGRAMADANPAAHIAIIKYAHGGTNLYSQWSATGTNYASFIATVQAGLAALTAAGVESKLIMVEGANHAWPLKTAAFDYTGEVAAFFDRSLKGAR